MPDVNLAQVVFDREQLSPDEDVAIITMHWRGAEPGFPDNWAPMTSTERGNATQKIESAFQGIKARFTNKMSLREVRWYATHADGTPAGGAIEIQNVNMAFTGVDNALPPQVACSVTWKTDKRATWGRFYLPGLIQTQLAPNGRLLDSSADAIVAEMAGLADRGSTVTETLTVWSKKEGTHHDPQVVQIDDVLDVIRSRRFSSTLYRSQVGL